MIANMIANIIAIFIAVVAATKQCGEPFTQLFDISHEPHYKRGILCSRVDAYIGPVRVDRLSVDTTALDLIGLGYVKLAHTEPVTYRTKAQLAT